MTGVTRTKLELPTPPLGRLHAVLRLAIEEDLAEAGDVTSRLTIAEDAVGVGTFVQKGAGVACGLPLVTHVAAAFDDRLVVDDAVAEGRLTAEPPVALLRMRGPLRALLTAERTALNLLTHLSGIATLTRRFVDAVAGTNAKIYDTRKTTPGLRDLEKYAVRVGGGHNHRMGLHDMVLVKDNHIAGLALPLAEAIAHVVERSRAEDPDRPIEVEVDTLDQLRTVLTVPGVDVILLDNMDCPTMATAVAMRDEANQPTHLEASGGVDLDTVTAIAKTGVDRIAIGALTHSAPALDIGLDVKAEL
ncbi:MAG: carboxylating nicotinate-nucleotide diphosphorylase [Planctomycetota bacterium]